MEHLQEFKAGTHPMTCLHKPDLHKHVSLRGDRKLGLVQLLELGFEKRAYIQIQTIFIPKSKSIQKCQKIHVIHVYICVLHMLKLKYNFLQITKLNIYLN